VGRREWDNAEDALPRTCPTSHLAELDSGTFGANSNGLDGLAGNVWEWTNSCFVRVSLDSERITNTNCGVRVVDGAHGSYMTDFIRDPRSGGCAAGVPPAGFRLVISVATSAVRNVAKLLRPT
jgi:formylglycine-generating enzyme required for sulfatase activity